jgi:putative ABC transport system substrate-binding protein
MQRRSFVFAAASTLALPRFVLAQAAKKVVRIVHLSGLSADTAKPGIALFRAGMRELGYAEGKNFVLEERYAAGRADEIVQ